MLFWYMLFVLPVVCRLLRRCWLPSRKNFAALKKFGVCDNKHFDFDFLETTATPLNSVSKVYNHIHLHAVVVMPELSYLHICSDWLPYRLEHTHTPPPSISFGWSEEFQSVLTNFLDTAHLTFWLEKVGWNDLFVTLCKHYVLLCVGRHVDCYHSWKLANSAKSSFNWVN